MIPTEPPFVLSVVDSLNRHDLDGYASFYAEDAVLHDPAYPEPLQGRNAIRADMANFFAGYPDAHFTLRSQIQHDAATAIELSISGTHTQPIHSPNGVIPPTNRAINLPMALFTICNEQGLMVEERRYYDMAMLIRQLGLGH